MAEKKFDAYHKLLGIPPRDQPPHHYRLLGVELFESDREVILSAADQRMLALEQMTTGEHAEVSQKLLGKVALARRVLLNEKQKAAYDQKLRDAISAKQAAATETARPPRPAAVEPALPAPAAPELQVVTSDRKTSGTPVKAWMVPAIAVGALLAIVIVSVLVIKAQSNDPQKNLTEADALAPDDSGQAASGQNGSGDASQLDGSQKTENPYTISSRRISSGGKSFAFQLRIPEPTKREKKLLTEMPEGMPLICIELIGSNAQSERRCIYVDQSFMMQTFYRLASDDCPTVDDAGAPFVQNRTRKVNSGIRLAVHDRAVQLAADGRLVDSSLVRKNDEPSFVPSEIIVWTAEFEGAPVLAIEGTKQPLDDTDVYSAATKSTSCGSGKTQLRIACDIDWNLLGLLQADQQKSTLQFQLGSSDFGFEITHDGQVLQSIRTRSDEFRKQAIGQLNTAVQTHVLLLDIHQYAVRLSHDNQPLGGWHYADSGVDFLPADLKWSLPGIFEGMSARLDVAPTSTQPPAAFDIQWTQTTSLREKQRLQFRLDQIQWNELPGLKAESGVARWQLESQSSKSPPLEFVLQTDRRVLLQYSGTNHQFMVGTLPDIGAACDIVLDVQPTIIRLFADSTLIGEPILAPPDKQFERYLAKAGVPRLNAERLLATTEIPVTSTATAFPVRGEPRPALAAAGGENAAGMMFAWCEPGDFVMGDQPRKRVLLSEGFYMAWFEVTRGEWNKLMKSEPWLQDPNLAKLNKPSHPAARISWEEAVEYCVQLTALGHKSGTLPAEWIFTLPTEAQWEYACRAGSTTRYCFGDDPGGLDDYAWLRSNVTVDQLTASPHRTGEKKANAWGLFDMHGNVAEWCLDSHLDEIPGGCDPFFGDANQRSKLFRGGHWKSDEAACASAQRTHAPADSNSNGIGFRVVLVRKSGR